MIKFEVIMWDWKEQIDAHVLSMALKRFNRPLVVKIEKTDSDQVAVIVVETKHRDQAKALFKYWQNEMFEHSKWTNTFTA